ncbi:inositol monophosphatase family protein [Synechococcus sp. BA-124 BA4]|uniref:inositol monophosphatase family protein n=1 Tax=unclassified Synechococcus TaxID=2626047 RepID=UPI0018CE0B96|nr:MULTISPECIES: inositol monophosphatase family protein [unclassified Synechococcus]MEA5400509.1 inositol monophosphatase family protein [Synechococcus sp. BA-124 BA4]QPN56184.1 inositol monophosphatase [Synechococcus sp. CBW1107]CAK6698861.1 Fructose-1,6-bisphosphatase/inositol-1-monophosphatase [Synechococcus sp. CBW1107]
MEPVPSLSGQALLDSALTPSEVERLVDVARDAAAAGAKVLTHHFGQLESIREKGRSGDLVTEADLAAEQAVLTVLEARTPELGVLAEESGRRSTGSQLEWCVDPLDGTTNYAHSYPFFATSIGLTWKGAPLLGAISVPALEELYWAAPGLGAWCNDRPLRVSGCNDLAASLLVTGFAYDRQTQPDTNYTEFCWFTHRSRGVRRGGAAAVDLAFVAAGRLDGYWERGLSPWDLAAGVALVEQAGGVVSRYDGSPATLAEGRLIACTPGLQAALIEGLAHCRPLPGHLFGAPELDL